MTIQDDFSFRWFLIVGLVLNTPISASADVQSDVWKCFSFFSKAINPYVAAINCVEKLKPDDTDFRDRLAYDQAEATALSFLGRENDSIDQFDRLMGNAPTPYSADLNRMRISPAVDEVARLAKTRQVVMINEAHHVPQTRWLTLQLLKPLFEQGFRYLAAETFNPSEMVKVNRLGFPTLGAGFYSKDPVFGEIIREAKRIGFTLVAYEHEGTCDYLADPVGCQNQREEGEAHNLIERILKKDPDSKILVLAGYGHISKIGGSEVSFPWKPMARYFKELSGIDPLSVDQIEFQMHGRLEIEDFQYRNLLAKFAPTLPSAILNEDGSPWLVPAFVGQYDLQIVLPTFDNRDGRATWRGLLPNRKPVEIALPKICEDSRCLADAISVSELLDNPVPSDQILSEGAGSTRLYLMPGRYVIRIADGIGRSLSQYLLEVSSSEENAIVF